MARFLQGCNGAPPTACGRSYALVIVAQRRRAPSKRSTDEQRSTKRGRRRDCAPPQIAELLLEPVATTSSTSRKPEGADQEGPSTDAAIVAAAAVAAPPAFIPGGPPISKKKLSRQLSARGSDYYILRTDGKTCYREIVRAPGCCTFDHPATNQYLLVWRDAPRNVLLLKKPGEELRQHLDDVALWLHHERGLKVVVEPAEKAAREGDPRFEFLELARPEEHHRLHECVDFVVCLGGDGVILHASTLFVNGSPPMIAFGLGSMGFLTRHNFFKFRETLTQLIDGPEPPSDDDGWSKPYQPGSNITLRMRLTCEVYRRGSPDRPEVVVEVMNEMVINRGLSPFLSKLELLAGGRLVTKVQADGVMLATPTGSTAYSVAAGGSMVHPGVAGILLTPICPHTLSFRPVILPDYTQVDLRVPDDARCSAWACFDGRSHTELQSGDYVRVRMSPHPVPTIDLADQTDDWFTSLQSCFGWNERMEQKPLEPGVAASLASSSMMSSSSLSSVDSLGSKQG